MGVRRAGRLFAPNWGPLLAARSTHGQAGDAARTLEVFGRDMRRAERVIVIGGGRVGQLVAQTIEARAAGRGAGLAGLPALGGGKGRQPGRVVLIERDRGRAEEVADSLGDTIVLQGDGLSPEILAEAGIAKADAVLAVTETTREPAACGAPTSLARADRACVNAPPCAAVAAITLDVHIARADHRLYHPSPRPPTAAPRRRLIADGEAELIELRCCELRAGRPQPSRPSLARGALLAGPKGARVISLPPTALEGDLSHLRARARVPEVERMLRRHRLFCGGP